jgi:transcriptional regulator with XRE-family HTH domain
MHGGHLIRMARKRAGLTQRELATRLGRPQSNVAAWESGGREPSLESLLQAVRACGLDLGLWLTSYDTSQDAFIWELLDAPPAERLRRQVAAANGVRPIARAGAAQRLGVRAGEPPAFDPLPVLRAFRDRRIDFVLIGRLAEGLRGSPNVPMEFEVAVCAATDDSNLDRLGRALENLGAERWEASGQHPLEIPLEHRAFEGAERWMAARSVIAVVERPPGSGGYGDLHRDATAESLARGLTAPVASLLDLIRIADASPRWQDRLGLPSLHRTLELSDRYLPPEQRPVVVPEGLEDLLAAHGTAGR